MSRVSSVDEDTLSTLNIVYITISSPAGDIVGASLGHSINLFQPGKKLIGIQPWGPVIDGDVLSEMPLKVFERVS